jgi:hypothetical protein
MVTPQERRAFLDQRRAITKERYDRVHSPTYDEHCAGHQSPGVWVDQSQGMLAVAHRKYPQAHTRVVDMQHLADQPDLEGIADAVLCVDAVENVGPEDWPVVVRGLMKLLRPGAPAYLTVELPDQPLPEPLDPCAVCGELVGEGYHYHPDPERVRQWLKRRRLRDPRTGRRRLLPPPNHQGTRSMSRLMLPCR